LGCLIETRPTIFVGVPRVWEKLQATIRAGVAAEPDKQRRAVVQHALDVAHQVAGLRHQGKPVPAGLDAAHARFAPVYAAIRVKLGFDQRRWAITSAAPTPLDVQLFFAGIGLPLREMWGMSELTGPATAVCPHEVRFGTCGAAIPGVEARIAADGELIVRGGNVMAGYYRAPAQTAQTVGPGGWLHTGDIALADPDGSHRIVDRKKELIITSGGKNIAPAQVEAQLTRHPLIGQAIAVGDRRSYLTAVLAVDADVAPAGHGPAASGQPVWLISPSTRRRSRRCGRRWPRRTHAHPASSKSNASCSSATSEPPSRVSSHPPGSCAAASCSTGAPKRSPACRPTRPPGIEVPEPASVTAGSATVPAPPSAVVMATGASRH
jgi:long-subunit acyl-CoA synthetase (AMP-forming)